MFQSTLDYDENWLCPIQYLKITRYCSCIIYDPNPGSNPNLIIFNYFFADMHSAKSGSAIYNRRELRSCLGRVFNLKLGSGRLALVAGT